MASVLAADGARPTVEFDQVRQPQKWWRKDGTRPIVGESTDGLLWHDPTTRHEDGELRAVRTFREAVESGDDSRLDELAAAAQAAEDAEDKKSAARDAAQKRRDAIARTRADRIDALIGEGWNGDDAESEVTGQSVESIRKRNYLTSRPNTDGLLGSFAKESKPDWLGEVERLMQAAEDATRGFLVKREHEGKINPARIWLTDSDAVARKYMSEDLARWFDANPNSRPTLAEFRDSILGVTRYRRRDGHLQ